MSGESAWKQGPCLSGRSKSNGAPPPAPPSGHASPRDTAVPAGVRFWPFRGLRGEGTTSVSNPGHSGPGGTGVAKARDGDLPPQAPPPSGAARHAARARRVPRRVENAAAVRPIACLPLHAGPTPVGSLVLVALAPRSFGERDVRTLERPLGELAAMIEAVRRRGGRGEPLEAPRAPVAAPPSPPPPPEQPAAAVTELQAEREQLRGEVAARGA